MSLTDLMQNLFYGLSIAGIVFAAYSYFRRPQEKSMTNEALFREKFSEFGVKLGVLSSDLTNLRDNHVHTLDVKFDVIKDEISGLKIEMGKLATIIDERIPKRKE